MSSDICGTASDPLKDSSASGLDKVEVSIKQDSSGCYWNGIAASSTPASVKTWNLATGTANWSYNLPTPPEGTYTIHSRATDLAGNTETSFDTLTFNEVHTNIDNTAPSSSVSFPANNADLTTTNYNNGCADATPDVCGSPPTRHLASSGVDKVEVSIQRAIRLQYWNGSSWQAGQAWNLASGTTSWSYGFTPASDDTYTVVSKATDNATNAETPAPATPSRSTTWPPPLGQQRRRALAQRRLHRPPVGATIRASSPPASPTSSTRSMAARPRRSRPTTPTSRSRRRPTTPTTACTRSSTGRPTTPATTRRRTTRPRSRSTRNPVSVRQQRRRSGTTPTTPSTCRRPTPGRRGAFTTTPPASANGQVLGRRRLDPARSRPTTPTSRSRRRPTTPTTACTRSSTGRPTTPATTETPHNSTTVKIDTEQPGQLGRQRRRLGTTRDYTVHLSATDPGPAAFTADSSGVARSSTRSTAARPRRAADNTDVTIPAPADHSNDGVHSIEYWATDNAATPSRRTTRPPSRSTRSTRPLGDNADATGTTRRLTVHLSATDDRLARLSADAPASANIKYSVDGGATQTVAADSTDVTIPAPADHSNDGVSLDRVLGDRQRRQRRVAAQPTTVKIDTQQPGARPTTPTPPGTTRRSPSTWPRPTPLAGHAFSPTPASSNLKYSVDGGATQTVAADNTDVTSRPRPITPTTASTRSSTGRPTTPATSSRRTTRRPSRSTRQPGSSNDNADALAQLGDTPSTCRRPTLAGPAPSPDSSGVKQPSSTRSTVARPRRWPADNTDVTIAAPADHSNDGVHSIEYWATDNAGNAESPHNSTTVKIDTSKPNSQITFPVNNTDYNTLDLSRPAAALVTGDICGTSADPAGTAPSAATPPACHTVDVSIKQDATGLYWNGTRFSASSETFGNASTADGWAHWSYNLATPPEGTYTIHSRATDVAGNVESRASTRRPSTRSTSTSTTPRRAARSASRPPAPT